jgi:hypothetical protein
MFLNTGLRYWVVMLKRLLTVSFKRFSRFRLSFTNKIIRNVRLIYLLDRNETLDLSLLNFTFFVDLIQNVFEILYYNEVVSELSLLSWMDAKDDVAGCQGKTEALKMAGSFLSWLVEDAEDVEK